MIGGGHCQQEESVSALGVPVNSENIFLQTEHDTREWWGNQLWEVINWSRKGKKDIHREE